MTSHKDEVERLWQATKPCGCKNDEPEPLTPKLVAETVGTLAAFLILFFVLVAIAMLAFEVGHRIAQILL